MRRPRRVPGAATRRRRWMSGRCRVAVLETRCVYSEHAEDHPLEAIEGLGLVQVANPGRRQDPGLRGGPSKKERRDAGDREVRIEVIVGPLARGRRGSRPPRELDEPFDRRGQDDALIARQHSTEDLVFAAECHPLLAHVPHWRPAICPALFTTVSLPSSFRGIHCAALTDDLESVTTRLLILRPRA